MFKYILLLLLLSGCSELLLLSSVGGVAVSQTPAIKAYNGIDALTILNTDKDIKKHVYDKLKGKNETKKSKPNE
jgi:hypothetical protein|tara:strand:- start:18 stop:239 length:222 start_codon:yes stop_codon:yes gene_type:complete